MSRLIFNIFKKLPLTPIRMAVANMTAKTLNRTNSKRPEEFFTLDLFLQCVLEFYLVKYFYQNIKNILFQKKNQSFHLFWVVFQCILAGRESYMTSRRPIRVWWGKGALTGSPPCFLSVACESLITPSCAATYFFTAIRIRVNF